MKPLFEIPELLHLNGNPFGPLSHLCDGAGFSCDKGCSNGCNSGCDTGSSTPKDPLPLPF